MLRTISKKVFSVFIFGRKSNKVFFNQEILATLSKPNFLHPDNTPKQFVIELIFWPFKTHESNFALLALNYLFKINLNLAFQ